MGTAGAYRFAADPRSATLVLNGDILTDIDLSKVIDLHRQRSSDATLVLAPAEDPGGYGLVKTESDKITGFIEKPKPDDLVTSPVNTINAGIYVLEPTIFDLIPKGENRSFEYDIFPLILEKRIPFFAYKLTDEYWRDIGTCRSYLAAHLDFLAGRIRGFDVERADVSDVATAASIDKCSVVGQECTVKPGAKIVNSVIGAGVNIEEKAVIENSVIWPHVRISTAAEVKGAIIGRGSHIGRNVTVGEGSVLGDKTSLPDYSRV
jgi:NDP-sugar pyrophosphorylase family protein